MQITFEYFMKCTGFPPENDDLERVNCTKISELGHMMCGWDHERDLPAYMSMRLINERMGKINKELEEQNA